MYKVREMKKREIYEGKKQRISPYFFIKSIVFSIVIMLQIFFHFFNILFLIRALYMSCAHFQGCKIYKATIKFLTTIFVFEII